MGYLKDIERAFNIDLSRLPEENDFPKINIGAIADYDFAKISKAANDFLASFKKNKF
jgi:hypothetical protein